jgi:Ser/Thr protein kinase RdoA (MazF antagonist)
MIESRNSNGAPDHDLVQKIARRFQPSASSLEIRQIGEGHINDSYLVTSARKRFILQRISGNVFKEPHKVALNSALVSAHVRRGRLARFEEDLPTIPNILPADDGSVYWQDESNGIWRAQNYIENSRVYTSLEGPEQAFEVGKCLAGFHRAVEDLSLEDMETVLPDFHNLPRYLQKYDTAVAASPAPLTAKLGFCRECVERYRDFADFFAGAIARGDVVVQVVHGDPKVSNILFDRDSGRALSMIDLDTVGPGLVLCDMGDCLRSAAFKTAEDDVSASGKCDTASLAAVLSGYLEKRRLSRFELDHIFEAFLLITFELAIRFLTDYLQGNRYFKVADEEDNLRRAITQFQRVEGIEAQQREIERVVSNSIITVEENTTGKE